jgi:hypothetical protein
MGHRDFCGPHLGHTGDGFSSSPTPTEPGNDLAVHPAPIVCSRRRSFGSLAAEGANGFGQILAGEADRAASSAAPGRGRATQQDRWPRFARNTSDRHRAARSWAAVYRLARGASGSRRRVPRPPAPPGASRGALHPRSATAWRKQARSARITQSITSLPPTGPQPPVSRERRPPGSTGYSMSPDSDDAGGAEPARSSRKPSPREVPGGTGEAEKEETFGESAAPPREGVHNPPKRDRRHTRGHDECPSRGALQAHCG